MMAGAKRKSKSFFSKLGNSLVKQIKENKTRFLTVIGFIIGLVVIGIFIFMRIQTVNLNASNALSQAYSFFAQGQMEQGVAKLDEIIAYYPNTPTAYNARLIKADYFIEQEEYEKVYELLKETYDRGRPEIIKPLALVRIINLYERREDVQNAVMSSNEFINRYGDHFFAKDVYMNLARYYLVLNMPEDAKLTLTEILANFPATEEATLAEGMLSGIN